MASGRSTHNLKRALLDRAHLQTLLIYSVVGALLIAAIAFFGREIGHHVDAIEAWLRDISPWGPVVYVAVFVVLTSLMVPTTVLSLIAGALFGPAWGTLAVSVGALAASPIQYLVARRLLRDPIMRKLSTKPSLLSIVRAVHSHGLRLQVLVRLTPLSPALGSYLFGAAGVRFSVFFIACFALIPGLFLEVFFGHAGKRLTGMASRDGAGVHPRDALIIGGVVVVISVMLLVSRTARRAVKAAVAEGGGDGAG